STSSSESATACDSYTWSVNGQTYTVGGTYTHVGTNAAGCPHTTTLNLTINQSTSSSESATACDSYTWAANGTTYTVGGIYTHITTNAAGFPHTATLNLVIHDSPVASCSVLNHVSCFGESDGAVSVTATGGTGPYTISGTTTGLSQGTYTFMVTDVNGCTSTCTVTINEPTKVEASSTASTPANCGSSDGSASVTATGGAGGYSYSWSPGGQTGSTATGLAPGVYTVTITDADNCTGTATVTVGGVGGQPDPAGQIAGPAGACRNQSGVVFTVPPVSGATSYIWTLPIGATGSSTSNSITVSFSNTYAGGFICVTPENTCGLGIQSCLNVPVLTVRPAQPGFIIGNNLLCGGGVFSFSVPAMTNATNYFWSVTGSGVVIVSGQGTPSVQISVPTTFGQGTISVRGENCIGNTSTRTMVITGKPAHSMSLNGPLSVCANTSGVAYSIDPVLNASSYSWTTTGDIVAAPSNTNSVMLNFGPGFTSGTLTVTTHNICGTFDKTYTIRSVPFMPGGISGPGTNLCNLTGVTYSIAAIPGATGYTWTVPSGVNIITNTGTSITVNFTAAFTGTGNICVTADNSCGSSSARCYSVTARPAPPASPSGLASVCKTNAAATYTIPPVPGATHYLWSISGGATPGTSTIGTTSQNFNFTTATSTTAVITVNAVNACGFSQPGKRTVTVNLACREASTSVSNTVQIYPNPANDRTTVSFEAASSANYLIKLHDILGNEVMVAEFAAGKGLNNYEINLNKFAKGMYLLSVQTEGNPAQTLRLVVE
ncbi:MAG: T9SS C-terminal target domain-containing protein, partial [Bacteroidetes bacterium]